MLLKNKEFIVCDDKINSDEFNVLHLEDFKNLQGVNFLITSLILACCPLHTCQSK